MDENPSVQDYHIRVKRITRNSMYIGVALFIGILTPLRTVFTGLILGLTISLFNFRFTAKKVNRLGELASTIVQSKKKRPLFFGFATRTATSILAVMLVFRYPQYFHLFSTLIGLFIVQAVAVFDGLKHKW